MFGNNPKRRPEHGTGNALKVQEIFATLQGEGPYAGWPAIFVRLGGCNLACDFCDTEFETFEELELSKILQKITQINKKGQYRLIVITGGEPFRQNIRPFCNKLLRLGFLVQVETNGTLYLKLPRAVKIICSPKTTSGKYHKIRPDLLPHISAFKFLISAHNTNYSKVAEVGQKIYQIPVYVQPMDELDIAKNQANLALAVKMAEEHGYILSMQLHKIIGIR